MQNKNTTRTSWAGAMLVLLSSGLCGGVQAQDLVHMVAELEPSVFEIHSFGENGLPTASGTGFIIGPEGVALTNWHVMEDCAFAVGLFEDGTVAEVVEVQKASEAIDLAQIQVDLALLDHDRIVAEALAALQAACDRV